MGITYHTGSKKDLNQILEDAERTTLRAGRLMAESQQKAYQHNIEINTPVETRRLRDSYQLTPVTYRQSQQFGHAVYVWTGDVFTEVEYASYVEYGTGLWGPRHAKYKIAPKTPGGVLAFQPYMRGNGSVILDTAGNVSKGNKVFVRFVMHPGSPGAAMFRIGAVITEHEVDEWSHRALDMWKREIESGNLASMPSVESSFAVTG